MTGDISFLWAFGTAAAAEAAAADLQAFRFSTRARFDSEREVTYLAATKPGLDNGSEAFAQALQGPTPNVDAQTFAAPAFGIVERISREYGGVYLGWKHGYQIAYLTPEAKARVEIDGMLAASGWAVQNAGVVTSRSRGAWLSASSS